jgi:hypothetical protein
MQTPTNFNDQDAWGGQQYEPEGLLTDTDDDNQATVVAHGQQEGRFRPFSQAGFIPSSSDNLLNPISEDPSSYVFNLPEVTRNPRPRHHAYN